MSEASKPDNFSQRSVGDFFSRFPDEHSCLRHIMEVRYGMVHVCRACGVKSTFHKLTSRRAFSCARCGDHVYPTAGTIFHRTEMPLQVWFYAIYLYVIAHGDLKKNELEYTLGITRNSARRLREQINQIMTGPDGVESLLDKFEKDQGILCWEASLQGS